ncbi:RNase H domain-containing protein [Trichonephila clavipes]|nr:RNase H domain-containing protein [Trichonephila clavipes]
MLPKHQILLESCANYGGTLPVNKPKRNKGGRRLWRKVKAANGLYREFTIPILETSTGLYSSPFDVGNLIGQTFSSVSSSDSYSPAFQATKNRLDRTPINFRGRQPLPYNCDFDMWELKRALSSAHNTSPGPDGIFYELLHHLNEDSLVSLLYLFNRIWRKQVYPTQWQEAIVIFILKPGKERKNPLSYRQIALTSCLCKTLEQKTVSVVFSRKRGVFPNPELFIGRSLIKLVNEVKFLGLISDQSRRFHRHLKDLKIRSAKALNILKVLANTRWGADRTSLLRLYRALIRSKLDYGSMVYSTACKSLLKILDPVHHQALRLCLAAFRTSPVESLYAEAY